MSENYLVRAVENPHPIRVQVPGSKSITNRALLIAALAQGKSTLSGVLFSDDSRNFLKSLQALGFETVVDEEKKLVTITGCGGRIPRKEASVYVGSAGTAARFLTAYLGLSDGSYRIDASEQMKKRPMGELLTALQVLGAEVSYEEEEEHFPFTISNHAVRASAGGTREVTVDIDKSSQFLSALLISSVLFTDDLLIHITGSHGMAYVKMTIAMMEQFGVKVEQQGEKDYLISSDAAYQARQYAIEPDLSAACYFYAMAPILGVSAQVAGVHTDSLQGDLQFLQVLRDMGCRLQEEEAGILLFPPEESLEGGRWDLSSFSDQALTLAALAPFASAPVTIAHVGHIRYQECDRIAAITGNLAAMGINCEEKDGNITIYPGTPKPCLVHTCEDHRVAMAFSLCGLRSGGIEIENYRCCRKTFENYFEVLDSIK